MASKGGVRLMYIPKWGPLVGDAPLLIVTDFII